MLSQLHQLSFYNNTIRKRTELNCQVHNTVFSKDVTLPMATFPLICLTNNFLFINTITIISLLNIKIYYLRSIGFEPISQRLRVSRFTVKLRSLYKIIPYPWEFLLNVILISGVVEKEIQFLFNQNIHY